MKVVDHKLFFGAALAVAAMSSHAQTFNLDPGPCGLANTPVECAINAGAPQPPLNEYSWGTFYLNSGYIVWENAPLGPLGTSTVSDSFCAATGTFTSRSSSITACTTMTVVFGGNYLATYGGGSYSGIATINFRYAIVPNRYYVRWGRNVTGGVVKIY
jgi:hypothetical protein